MRRFTAALLCTALLCWCTCCACAEGKNVLEQDEWTWTSGEVATFKGVVDTTGLDLSDTSLCISVRTVPEQEDPGRCVFTSLNGKRIKIRNQSDTISLSDTEASDEIAFGGSWFLPEEGQVKQVTLTVSLMKTSTGETLKALELACKNEAWYDAGSGQPYHLPIDLNQLCWILGGACILLWGAAILRSLLIRRRKTLTEKE